MNIEEWIDDLSKEIMENYKNLSRIDVIRRMKQLMRETASRCSNIILEDKKYIYADELFGDKRLTAEEFADKTSNRILNEFLS